MANWRQVEPKVWSWRVRGKAADGVTVTLGSFDTKAEATAEYEKLVKEGYYKKLRVESITPPPPAPPAKPT